MIIKPTAYDSSALLEVTEFLSRMFPNARGITPEYLRWAYMLSPDGVAMCANAYVNGTLVGHGALQPMRARVAGVEQLGVTFVHAAVSPRHRVTRGRQTFWLIYDSLLTIAVAQGFQFMVAVANAATSRFRSRRAQVHQEVGALEARIGLGPPPRSRFDQIPDFQRIWQKETLLWRLARPGSDYWLMPGKSSLSIYSESPIPGVSLLMGEFDVDLCAGPRSRKRRTSPIRAWVGIDSTREWSWRPYIRIPERYKPSPLMFSFRSLTEAANDLDRKKTRVQALDLDVF